MNITSKTKKKFVEATYLATDNAFRYRVILRISYNEYEKMKFWLYKEEIFDEIRKLEGFEEYTLDNLKQDLDSLEGWGNFITVQDTNKTKTLEEFKNRRYRYQISPNTIELERTLIKLESISESARGSLEITLIERFRESLEQLIDVNKLDSKSIFSKWDIISKDFKELNENYKDYIGKFYSPKTEGLLKTTEFTIYKESFIKYLREFIKGLQINVPKIKYIFQNITYDEIKGLIKSIVQYEKMNIVLEINYDLEESFNKHYERYLNMRSWFIGYGLNTSMIDNLLDNTNEIIRRITRYALQIIELETSGGSRKEEYRSLINIFNNCSDIDEAHRLSAVVFGVISSRHIVFDNERETESTSSSIFDEKPIKVIVKPSNRYREKTASRVYVRDKSLEKAKKAKIIIEKRNKEREMLERRIKDNRLVFKDLDGVTKEERSVFLKWLSNALNKKGNWVKNEFGRYYKVIKLEESQEIIVRCEDGDFYMPNFELIFREEGIK